MRRVSVVIAAVLSSCSAAPAQKKTAADVARHGVVWHFADPATVGQFANGDWWVLAPVTVRGIDPSPLAGRNGTMRNPHAGLAGRTTHGQAYDDRAPDYRAESGVVLPIELAAGDVLISTISRPVDGAAKSSYRGQPSRSWLRAAAVLTCLDEPPPADAFRPSYCGPRAMHRVADLRWDLLPRLAPVGASPAASRYADLLSRVWLDHVPGWQARFTHPYENMPDYGRDLASLIGEAGLVLLEDRPRKDVRELMVNYVQLGIDLWGLRQDGHEWWADGGHGVGRKWPILFAGLMLGDQAMQTPGHAFSEDQQTYAAAGPDGPAALWRFRPGLEHEERAPADWTEADVKGEKYRRCCTSPTWVATALCAHRMNATALWDHAPFFAYVDRWMTPMDEAAVAKARPELARTLADFPHGYTGSDYVTQMWQRHRLVR